MDSISIQGAPSYYQCEVGVLDQLPTKIIEQGFKKGLFLHGNQSLQAANPYLPDFPLAMKKVLYKGECTQEEVNRIVKKIVQEETDFILGVGGGKVLDIAKAAGHLSDIPVILIPTLASNCAPWTPLSVFYDENRNFTEYIVYPKSTFMVLVEPRILLEAPIKFIQAGIGDTLAKWYEADVLSRSMKNKPLAIQIALHAATLCKEVLVKESVRALQAVENKMVSSSFINVIETIIMAGGMVGGFGGKYGRIAGAHSIHNGLTTLPETHRILHGNKVAYGILVQLALENRFDEISNLVSLFQDLQFPLCLADLGIKKNVKQVVKQVAIRATREEESIHLMGISTPNLVEEAMLNLEEFMIRVRITN
ncbi:iron-containing alcohol dehydrogenase family protein [Salirhabdus sp. Marseille-P4669]|uniref:iron-containing alcohol dehydrogenase family protein n=1 Tax=Salirhabdus sp. Marseille-P4669 TaxID=2042310 RepID=UPI000C7B401D|nr:iron-containing alcohol dehydrogenase family protein [Salirhabdus sp. Marseille-P4669]